MMRSMGLDRARLLERYRGGTHAVLDALAGATDEDLDRAAPDGGWTARDVVHHLAESESNGFIRLRRLIAEDEPLIVPYDQDEWARRNHYGRPIGSSLAVLEAVRVSCLDLLGSLTAEEWERAGRHAESGQYTVDDWLGVYAQHPHDHAAQIRRARGHVEHATTARSGAT